MIPLEITSIGLDPRAQAPVLLLQAVDGSGNYDDRIMPITLGHPEAGAIIAAMQGVSFPRPTAPDVMAAMLNVAGMHLEHVAIVNFIDGVYFSNLVVRQGETITYIDARPSDAIALAMRVGSPIFIDEHIFIQASLPAGNIHLQGPSPYEVTPQGMLRKIENHELNGSDGSGPNISDIMREIRNQARGMGIDTPPFGQAGWNYSHMAQNYQPNIVPGEKISRKDLEGELTDFRDFLNNVMPEDFSG